MTKAKQKTATIEVYQPFQARGWCADIYYRGKLVWDFANMSKQEVIASAVNCAMYFEFTSISFKVKE